MKNQCLNNTVSTLLAILLLSVLGTSLPVQAQIPHFEWVRSVGEHTSSENGRAVVTDAKGNAYVTGQFVTKVLFDKFKLTNVKGNQNNVDIFVTKYNASGVVVWVRQITGKADDFARSIALDGSGNCYVAGSYTSASLKSGGSSITNGGLWDMFVAKFDSNGTPLWIRGAGGAGVDSAFCVTVDHSGNAYVIGSFQSSSITFGATTLTNHSVLDPFGTRYNDIFLVKYDPSGNVLAAQSYGDSTWEEARDIRVDDAGNIFLAGSFSHNMMIDTCHLIFAGGIHPTGVPYPDVFLAKLSPTFNAFWVKTFGFIAADVPYGVGFDHAGNSYVAGSFESDSIRFDSLTRFDNAGYKDIFLAKFDPTGAFVWARHAGAEFSEEVSTLQVDSAGDCYLGGYFESSSLAFGSTTLTNASTPDSKMFVVKYDKDGNVLWVKSAKPQTGIEHLYKLAINGTGTLYATGSYTSNTLKFGNLTVVNATQALTFEDMYLLKIYEPTITSSTMFRTFSQTDLDANAVKVKGIVTPTFGNARDTTFLRMFPRVSNKLDLTYPGGLVLGVARPESSKIYGWIRFTLKGKTIQDFVPQTNTARGFDVIGSKSFVKELSNPKPTKYNNVLAGELAALKMNIAASTCHVIPEGFCDLVFNESTNPANVLNGRSMGQISSYVDSMLTYYKKYYTSTPPALYDSVAFWLGAINNAFSGSLALQSQNPIRLTGVKHLSDVSFLQAPAALVASAIPQHEETVQANIVEQYSLAQNYPNPFNPVTTISYTLPANSNVTLKVYNILGEEIATLVNQSLMTPGEHETSFDGNSLATGIYFYKLSATNLTNGATFSDVKRMLLIK